MAEVKEEEEQKKGGILKIILFVIGGILLIILGLGIGYFIFGGEPEQDPSQEVNQIIEGEPKVKDDQTKGKNTDETNEEGIITKNVKQFQKLMLMKQHILNFLVTSLQI